MTGLGTRLTAYLQLRERDYIAPTSAWERGKLNAREFKRCGTSKSDLLATMDEEQDYEATFGFLTFHCYPIGFSKKEKRILRRKCQEHFRVKRGLLYYSALRKCEADAAKRQGKRMKQEWRRVPKTGERKRILESCHSSVKVHTISIVNTDKHFICKHLTLISIEPRKPMVSFCPALILKTITLPPHSAQLFSALQLCLFL